MLSAPNKDDVILLPGQLPIVSELSFLSLRLISCNEIHDSQRHQFNPLHIAWWDVRLVELV